MGPRKKRHHSTAKRPFGRPVALTIAGSDPSGGAGIQADLKTFALHGVYGASVLTALTVQDSTGVAEVRRVSARLVARQLEAVLGALPVAAVKTGMLAGAPAVRAVARALRGRGLPLVVDPVIRATSGAELLSSAGLELLRRELLPLATLVTPNLDEASTLLGRPVGGARDMRRAARELLELGPRAVLLKGGHLRGPALDVLAVREGPVVELSHPREPTGETHGTGCVLSAAVAARLARGERLEAAVGAGVGLIAAILRRSPRGRERGPADPLRAATIRLAAKRVGARRPGRS